jgi:hypothetical protein
LLMSDACERDESSSIVACQARGENVRVLPQ